MLEVARGVNPAIEVVHHFVFDIDGSAFPF
jgi:hypothetical protein